MARCLQLVIVAMLMTRACSQTTNSSLTSPIVSGNSVVSSNTSSGAGTDPSLWQSFIPNLSDVPYTQAFASRVSLMAADVTNVWRVELMLPVAISSADIHYTVLNQTNDVFTVPDTVTSSTSSLLGSIATPIDHNLDGNSSIYSAPLQLNYAMTQLTPNHYVMNYIVFNPNNIQQQLLYYFFTISTNTTSSQDTAWISSAGYGTPQTITDPSNVGSTDESQIELIDTTTSNAGAIQTADGFEYFPTMMHIVSASTPDLNNMYLLILDSTPAAVINSVKVEYTINTNTAIDTAMIQRNSSEWSLPLILSDGDVIVYNFTLTLVDGKTLITSALFEYRIQLDTSSLATTQSLTVSIAPFTNAPFSLLPTVFNAPSILAATTSNASAPQLPLLASAIGAVQTTQVADNSNVVNPSDPYADLPTSGNSDVSTDPLSLGSSTTTPVSTAFANLINAALGSSSTSVISPTTSASAGAINWNDIPIIGPLIGDAITSFEGTTATSSSSPLSSLPTAGSATGASLPAAPSVTAPSSPFTSTASAVLTQPSASADTDIDSFINFNASVVLSSDQVSSSTTPLSTATLSSGASYYNVLFETDWQSVGVSGLNYVILHYMMTSSGEQQNVQMSPLQSSTTITVAGPNFGVPIAAPSSTSPGNSGSITTSSSSSPLFSALSVSAGPLSFVTRDIPLMKTQTLYYAFTYAIASTSSTNNQITISTIWFAYDVATGQTTRLDTAPSAATSSPSAPSTSVAPLGSLTTSTLTCPVLVFDRNVTLQSKPTDGSPPQYSLTITPYVNAASGASAVSVLSIILHTALNTLNQQNTVMTQSSPPLRFTAAFSLSDHATIAYSFTYLVTPGTGLSAAIDCNTQSYSFTAPSTAGWTFVQGQLHPSLFVSTGLSTTTAAQTTSQAGSGAPALSTPTAPSSLPAALPATTSASSSLPSALTSLGNLISSSASLPLAADTGNVTTFTLNQSTSSAKPTVVSSVTLPTVPSDVSITSDDAVSVFDLSSIISPITNALDGGNSDELTQLGTSTSQVLCFIPCITASQTTDDMTTCFGACMQPLLPTGWSAASVTETMNSVSDAFDQLIVSDNSTTQLPTQSDAGGSSLLGTLFTGLLPISSASSNGNSVSAFDSASIPSTSSIVSAVSSLSPLITSFIPSSSSSVTSASSSRPQQISINSAGFPVRDCIVCYQDCEGHTDATIILCSSACFAVCFQGSPYSGQYAATTTETAVTTSTGVVNANNSNTASNSSPLNNNNTAPSNAATSSAMTDNNMSAVSNASLSSNASLVVSTSAVSNNTANTSTSALTNTTTNIPAPINITVNQSSLNNPSPNASISNTSITPANQPAVTGGTNTTFEGNTTLSNVTSISAALADTANSSSTNSSDDDIELFDTSDAIVPPGSAVIVSGTTDASAGAGSSASWYENGLASLTTVSPPTLNDLITATLGVSPGPVSQQEAALATVGQLIGYFANLASTTAGTTAAASDAASATSVSSSVITAADELLSAFNAAADVTSSSSSVSATASASSTGTATSSSSSATSSSSSYQSNCSAGGLQMCLESCITSNSNTSGYVNYDCASNCTSPTCVIASASGGSAIQIQSVARALQLTDIIRTLAIKQGGVSIQSVGSTQPISTQSASILSLLPIDSTSPQLTSGLSDIFSGLDGLVGGSTTPSSTTSTASTSAATSSTIPSLPSLPSVLTSTPATCSSCINACAPLGTSSASYLSCMAGCTLCFSSTTSTSSASTGNTYTDTVANLLTSLSQSAGSSSTIGSGLATTSNLFQFGSALLINELAPLLATSGVSTLIASDDVSQVNLVAYPLYQPDSTISGDACSGVNSSMVISMDACTLSCLSQDLSVSAVALCLITCLDQACVIPDIPQVQAARTVRLLLNALDTQSIATNITNGLYSGGYALNGLPMTTYADSIVTSVNITEIESYPMHFASNISSTTLSSIINYNNINNVDNNYYYPSSYCVRCTEWCLSDHFRQLRACISSQCRSGNCLIPAGVDPSSS